MPEGVRDSPSVVFSRNLKELSLSKTYLNAKKLVLSAQDANIVLIYFDMTDDDVNACRKLPIATLSLMCGLPNGFVLLWYKIMQLQDNMSNCTLTCPFG